MSSVLRAITLNPKRDSNGQLVPSQKIQKGFGDFLEFGMVLTNLILTIMLLNADLECATVANNDGSTPDLMIANEAAEIPKYEDKCVEAWLYGSSQLPTDILPNDSLNSAHNHEAARTGLVLLIVCVLGYFINLLEFVVGFVTDMVVGELIPLNTPRVSFVSFISSLTTCILTLAALVIFENVRLKDTTYLDNAPLNSDGSLGNTGYKYESSTGFTFIYVIFAFTLFPLFRDFVKWAIASENIIFKSINRQHQVVEVGSKNEQFPIMGSVGQLNVL